MITARAAPIHSPNIPNPCLGAAARRFHFNTLMIFYNLLSH
jgi:hypothetical protein